MQGRFLDVYIILIMMFIAGTAIVLAEGTGRIAGQLIDDQSGDPIEAATVVVAGSRRGAVTDFSGRYVIGGLEPGTYTLVCSGADYCTDTLKTVPVRSNTTTNASNRMLNYMPGEDIVQIDKERMAPADTVVTGASGVFDELLWEAWCEIRNKNGERFVRGPGTLQVYLAVRVDACGDTVIVTFDQSKTPILCLIEGTVTDAETGKPIAGANARVVESEKGTLTDKEGKFICRELEPNCYAIEVSHPDYETIRMSEVKVHSSGTRISCQLQRLNK